MTNLPEELTRQAEDMFALTPPGLRKNPRESARPRILVGAMRQHYLGSAIDLILSNALRLHGARVDVLLCDQVMPVCDHRNIDTDTAETCAACWHHAHSLFMATDLPLCRVSEFLDKIREIEIYALLSSRPRETWLEMEYLGVRVGQIAYSSTLRHFLRGRLNQEHHWQKFQQFLVTAIMMVDMSRKLIARLQPDALLISHGLYVTWGVLADYARQNGVQVTVYGYGYRKNSLLVSQGRTYHHDLLVEPTATWRDQPFADEQHEEITQYLRSRVNGGLDWISYSPNPQVNHQEVIQQLNLDRSQPTIGMFTNLVWDAAVLFRGAVFSDMTSWVVETIRWGIEHSDMQLLIRCHPAEVRRKSQTREKIADVIRSVFPELPSYIKIIPAESDLSTYTLSELIDVAIVYSSKIGLEFAARGIPVIVAGEAFYRGKGFTYDPLTKEEYFEQISEVNAQKQHKQTHGTAMMPSLQATDLALKYAYHYFFRRHITLPYFADHGVGNPITHFTLDDLRPLTPGQNVMLDRFCEMVLEGKKFF
ncbi:capsule polysaccharide biosynthesis protein [Candidatus Vecturithrix granuli]|uniref:Capsule polysaccharide biosynthesis protein n=1 Tax=Vecturithrix granuli TaxID=1499967 RepID=A0A081C0Z1_VECG1|nr:capsule polysaccharide biosynthesis protein [Candidatus Vecturithrix granuli]